MPCGNLQGINPAEVVAYGAAVLGEAVLAGEPKEGIDPTVLSDR